MSIIGTIAVNVVSRHTAFVRGMSESRTALTKFSTSISTADSAMRSFRTAVGVGLAALTTGRVVSSIRATAEQMDALGKSADKLGVSSAKLAGVHLGAELEGLDVSGVDQSILQMTRRIAILAKTGKGDAAPAMKELGIEINKISLLTPDKQLEVIADRLSKVTSQSDKLRLAFMIFGKSGTGMVNLLKDGAAGLKEYHKEAEALGIAIDRDTIKRVEEMNDALTRLSASISGIRNEIVINIAPAATAGIDALTEAVKGIRAIHDEAGRGSKAGTARGPLQGIMSGTGSMHPLQWLEDLIVRKQLEHGFATYAPAAPVGLGAGGIASLMARQPGFNPEAVQQSREAGVIAAEKAAEQQAGRKALDYLFLKGKESAESWASGWGAVLKARAKDVSEAVGTGLDALGASNRQFMAEELSGRASVERDIFKKKLAEVRRTQGLATTESEFGFNPVTERGSGGYAASRASDRVNKTLNQQLLAANRTAKATEQIAAKLNQAKINDLFAGL